MNMRYKTREHMPPSLPISLRPVLLLQVSCDFQDEFKSQSISALLWQLISHSYGSVLNDMISLVKITVTGKLNSLTSEHQAAKAAALDFLESHPDASVILFVDGHTFTQDGTVVYFDNESAPLSVLLLLCLGTNLWNAINASTGPIKLLVAMVCGWIWHWPQSVDQAGDVLRTWTYQTKNKKWTLPPLCKDAVGFSSTVVIPGVIASALASALEMAILFATPIDKAVLWRVGMSHELMRSTGIVLGTASEDNAPCFHILVRQSDYNIFGLPPVDNCPCCRERVEVHQSKLRKSGPQIKKRLRCSSCGLRTQWFEAPEAAMVPNELYLYRWPLPAPKPEWRWKDPSKDPSKDRARSVDILESP
ncbi:hypothetical protein FRB90_012623 [Tulasnella sp. 427]|nr:hypothetical protein FRB90_012623 [Tulasnella sp. 427]